MELHRAKSAVSAASAALIVFCACVAMFLPPFNDRVSLSVPLLVLLGLAISVSLILHLVFVAIAARQLGKSAVLWPVVALVTLPLGSIIGVVLFEWALKGQSKVTPSSAA
jgi:hypothetical protein